MRIGVDLDDTLSIMKDQFDLQICEFAKKIGKTPDLVKIKNAHKNPCEKNIYDRYCNLSPEEIKQFFFYYHENISLGNPARENCAQVLERLKKDGHEIIILTARQHTSHPDIFNITKKWLDKNNIPYDKIILECGTKCDLAKQEQIDVLIDDNLNNCLETEKVGIHSIVFANTGSKNSTTDWLEVEKMIKNIEKTKK